MSPLELLIALIVLFAILRLLSDRPDRTLVHACLPIRVVWTDENFRSSHFTVCDENPVIELFRYIWTPGLPQVGSTYKFLDTRVEVEEVFAEYPDQWTVRARLIDTSSHPLTDDDEL